jgi:outer membrane protein OmpA-like peptidoglycan-associated protein
MKKNTEPRSQNSEVRRLKTEDTRHKIQDTRMKIENNFQFSIFNFQLVLTLTVAAILLSIVTTDKCCYAQDRDNPRYGAFIHFNLNQHYGDFDSIPGVSTCCPKFKDGNGTGVSAGLLYEFPIAKNLFLGARAGYYMRNGKFVVDENETVNLNGEAVNGVFEHTLDTKLSIIGIEPMVGYRIWNELFLHGGFQVGFLNLSKQFEHTEKILQPSTGTYENDLRERLIQKDDLQNVSSLHFSLLAGLSYELPLNKDKTLILAPEVFYTFGLTNNVKDVSWKISTLRIGAGLKYSTSSAYPLQRGTLMGDINAASVDAKGLESPIVTIKVEEFLSSNLKPLLSYVFFDENSSVLPSRYQKFKQSDTKNFSIDQLYNLDAVETYYHVLNIIGKRMQDYPDAKIAIDGCNSNSGPEANNQELSRKRAETVRDYLQNIWGITPDRMILSKRNLPQEPSNIKEADGIVENRRVEITTNKWEILAPVASKDTFRITSPPDVRFRLTAKADVGIKEWNVKAYQKDNLLYQFAGSGQPSETLEWQMDLKQKNIPRSSEMLDYKMELIDNNNEKFETQEKSLPVEQITIQKKKRESVKDKYIERFSLILFSFDESKLSLYNKKVVDLIQAAIKPNSTVYITGHTDRMGNDSYNQKLSKERATTLSKALKATGVTIEGKGETRQVYDNDFPEGRFYCRRVDVIVETPME